MKQCLTFGVICKFEIVGNVLMLCIVSRVTVTYQRTERVPHMVDMNSNARHTRDTNTALTQDWRPLADGAVRVPRQLDPHLQGRCQRKDNAGCIKNATQSHSLFQTHADAASRPSRQY